MRATEPQGALAAPATAAFELADFETPLSTTALPNVVWSIEKHTVAQLIALSGLSLQQVSRETGVPIATISKWRQHGEFTDYINKIVLESATVMKAKRLQLLTKILDARVAEAEKTNDYSRLSKLDTVEIIDRLRKETGEDEAQEESKYSRIIGKIAAIAAAQAKDTKTIDVTPS